MVSYQSKVAALNQIKMLLPKLEKQLKDTVISSVDALSDGSENRLLHLIHELKDISYPLGMLLDHDDNSNR